MEQACTVDLTNEKAVVQHIKDLLNLADLLERGFDEELGLLIEKLCAIGWDNTNINRMLTYAAVGTRYEKMEDSDGNRIVPRNIPERGDQAEWRRIKPRAKK